MKYNVTPHNDLYPGDALVNASACRVKQNTLHHFFEQQVNLMPDNVAVIFRGHRLTYQELNVKTNQLAAYLKQQFAVCADKPIGIMLQRSEKMIIGILAILKAGGTYVPIDPGNPFDYSAYICTDCDIDIILTDNNIAGTDRINNVTYIDLNNPEIYQGEGENLSVGVSPTDLAYIIYTSGSTGKPKGVMIEHRSIINKLQWMQYQYPLTNEDTVLQKSNFVFDVSVWELLWPLISGARLCFLEPGAQVDPEKIIEVIVNARVTMVHFVPPMLQLFLNYFEANPGKVIELNGVKRIFCSGEALTVKLANLFNKLIYKQLGIGLTNQYGPTEAAVEVTFCDCEQQDELKLVTIGKPIHNTEIYIADPDGSFAPEGETGELIIAGVQVARGYKNNPQLTSEKFIVNPFSPLQKMYRTGDKARIMPDGNIEFLGRIDDQVKINGYRVEPGQIEKLILKNSCVDQCVVSLRNVDGIYELVSYITAVNYTGDDETLIGELITGLKTQLPAHMVPVFVVRLTEFPITPTGKIDRKKLPSPLHRYHQKKKDVVFPQTHTQKIISGIWENALKVEAMGIDDNFFELGGSSMIVAKVVSQINHKFETKLTFSHMFKLPTVRELAHKIDHNESAPISPVVLMRPGIGTPVFLFPGVDSTPISFADFQNSYNGNQPLYSILYPGHYNNFAFSSMQQYAAYVVEQIKLICPDGPYAFLGYSLGGRLAFEVAIQMQQAKYKVHLLAIISAFPVRDAGIVSAFGGFVERFKTFTKLNAFLKTKYITHRLPYLLKTLISKGITNRAVTSDVVGYTCNKSHPAFVLTWDQYQTPSKFNGDLLLLSENMANETFNGYQYFDVYRNHVMAHRWQKYVAGKVDSQVIECSHHDFLAKPRVKEVANIIDKALNR